MSRLVVMEGWIKQKNKSKDMIEVYAVLTKTHLKIFKSQINYKQRPEDSLKVLNLTESYNILPMSFENEFTFSIFKKGEKAADRLYLQTTSKNEYESWLNQIEGVLSTKTKENESNSSSIDSSSTDSKQKSEVVEKSSNLKSVVQTKNSTLFYPTFNRSDSKDRMDKRGTSEVDDRQNNSKMDNLISENEKLKSQCASIEKELKKLKEINEKGITDSESNLKTISQTETKLKKAYDEIQRLKADKQVVNDKKIGLEKEVEKLKKSLKENNEIEKDQMNKIAKELSTKIPSNSIDLSSYMFCLDNLIEQNKSPAIIESLLKTQLTNLIHKCPVDLNTNISIIDFLSVNIDLSQNSIIQFLTKLLVTLSNSISKTTSPKSDLDPNIVSLIKNVVTMTKPSQKIDSQLNFHQTLLEVAYLLTKRNNFRTQLANGVVEDCKGIDNQFSNFLKSHKLEEIKKIMIIELGQKIKEKYQPKVGVKENIKAKENGNKTDSQLHCYLGRKWSEVLKRLDQKEQDIKDLQITINELSNRIITLECDNYDNNSMLSLDEMFNIYSMNADILCNDCQSRAINLLEMPVIHKVNTIVNEFQCYWKSILHVHSLLSTKQQYNSGLRDMFEKMSQSTQEFENLMKLFSEITQRKIENPSLRKTSPISNDH